MSAMVISGAGANVVRYFPGEPTTKLVDCPLPRRACIQIKRILHACLRAQRINLNLALGSTAVAACSTAATNEDEADRRLTTSKMKWHQGIDRGDDDVSASRIKVIIFLRRRFLSVYV